VYADPQHLSSHGGWTARNGRLPGSTRYTREPDRSTPHRTATMTHAQTAAVPAPSPERLRAAFDELHGSRLHGFALLLTLGDRARAARLAGEALAAAEPRIDALRHPERAAAWLRAHVVRSSHRPSRRGTDVP